MEKQKQNWSTIKCIHCGAELHPAEVFYPEDLLGDPRNIVRDPLGKILYVEYKEDCEPNLVQTFECPECGKQFVVEASVSFKVKKVPVEEDFSSDSVSLL